MGQELQAGDEVERIDGTPGTILEIDRHQALIDLGWDAIWVALHELRKVAR